MADIGATLREARTRQRIEISDLESETKIRAKYLRALENEEWDQLPGPTYVKSFLRTYADALGLDGKLLIAEYKLRHERLSDVELQPIAPPGRDRRRRAPRPGIPRGVIVAVAIAGLVVALYFIGRGSDDPKTASTLPPASTQSKSASKAAARRARARRAAAAKARRRKVRLAVIATGQVYVCLTGGGRTLVNGAILTGGARQGPWRAKRFRVTLGNGEARLVVNGRSRAIPAVTSGVGYEITPPARVRALPRASWPSCRA
jgi:transcriptional regulator with XRE-family HTH domain